MQFSLHFITKTDVLGGGLPVYTISRKVNETQNDFDDRTVFIYVNGEIMNDTPLGKIMHDFQCKSPDEMRSQPFADRLKELKGFDAEADVCVCCTHGEQYEQLGFIRDISAVVLRMGGRLQECLWGNQDALH